MSKVAHLKGPENDGQREPVYFSTRKDYVEDLNNATSTTSGLMSPEDKSKLDNIATGANKYVLPAATSSALGGVKVGDNISNASGKISISQQNVIGALGYNPADRTVGTKTALGLGKLYDTTGSAIDGSITQAKITSELNLKANLASPTFTGTPKAPTAAIGTNNTQLATTEFVQASKPAFGICSSTANIQNKVVTIPGFILKTGARISVQFTYSNNALLINLNVNNTGNYPICYRGERAIAQTYIREGMIVDFIFDGNYWQVVGEIGFSPLPNTNQRVNRWIVYGKPYLSPTYGAVGNAIHFDGRSMMVLNDYLTLGGADFTIDFWGFFRNPGLAFGRLVNLYGTKNQLRFSCATSGNGKAIFEYVTAEYGATEIDRIALERTSHYAAVYRQASKATDYYFNGEKLFTLEGEMISQQWYLTLGATFEYSAVPSAKGNYADGAVDELRISKCARYTENFTPSGTAYESDSNTVLLLHCD